MFTFIMTLVGAFFGAFFGIAGVILYDRFKRALPVYNFDFEKEVSYQTTFSRPFVSGLNILAPSIGHLKNYISVRNYGDVPLFYVSTKIWFKTRKERRYYQTMEIAENLFDLEVEHLSTYSPDRFQLDIISSMKSKEEVFTEKIKQGFFIPDSAMEKLKSLSPIKVKVEYTWEGKRWSDILLFDFSDVNEVRFGMSSPTFWQKIKLIFKRIF